MTEHCVGEQERELENMIQAYAEGRAGTLEIKADTPKIWAIVMGLIAAFPGLTAKNERRGETNVIVFGRRELDS